MHVCAHAYTPYKYGICVFFECVCEREEGSLTSCSQPTEALHWNVNWCNWSASKIRLKATFNTRKIRMSHCLAQLIQLEEYMCVYAEMGGGVFVGIPPFTFLPISLPHN